MRVCLFLVSHQHLLAQRETRLASAHMFIQFELHQARHNMPLMTTFRVAERANNVQFGQRDAPKCMLFARVHFLYAHAFLCMPHLEICAESLSAAATHLAPGHL
jgi:hypothetical protein